MLHLSLMQLTFLQLKVFSIDSFCVLWALFLFHGSLCSVSFISTVLTFFENFSKLTETVILFILQFEIMCEPNITMEPKFEYVRLFPTKYYALSLSLKHSNGLLASNQSN